LKEETLDRTMWRNRFGRGFGPVVWQITDDDDVMNVSIHSQPSSNSERYTRNCYVINHEVWSS